MFWLLLITAVVTTLLVLGNRWISRHRETHPELYKNRHTIRFFVWLIFNLGQV